MPAVLLFLAMVVAVAAAMRSTWSPCGLSMLSSITPLAEQGRGHRFRSTAAWFVVGALIGGLSLGVLAAVGAAFISALAPSATVVLGAAAIALLIGAASDSRVLGWHLPFHTRQVNEIWLNKYRSWVYGAGFGWQIGFGLATFIVTSATYLVVVLAALTGSPDQALAICATFGLVRGLAIVLGRGITSTATLIAFHRRFDAWREPVRIATIAVMAAGAVVAAFAATGVSALSILVAVAAAAIAVGLRRTRVPAPAADASAAVGSVSA